ncbi:MAG: hypothetical protein LW750_02895 [Bacteroidetes bacterium]|nr:hypothetical protein [Bacteroidota bacterium]
MNTRRIIWIGILSVALLGSLLAWFQLRDHKKPVGDALTAIPESASLVFRITDLRQAQNQLNQGNLIWEAIQDLEWGQETQNAIAQVDSILQQLKSGTDFSSGKSAWLSIHHLQNNSFSYVLSLEMDHPQQGTQLIEQLTAIRQPSNAKQVAVGDATLLENDRLSICNDNGVILVSENKDLIRTALETKLKGGSLNRIPTFNRVKETAGNKATINLYVNYQKLAGDLRVFAAAAEQKHVGAMGNFAAWTEVDLSWRSNALLMNGYTICNDSNANFLSVFNSQESQTFEADKVLPSNTISYVAYGISNFRTFLEAYDQYSANSNSSPARSEQLAHLKENHGFEPYRDFSSWVGNEIIRAEISSGEETETIALISSTNTGEAIRKLTGFISEDDTILAPQDSGISIYRIPVDGMLPATLGSSFEKLDTCYFTIFRHYVVCASSPATLNNFLLANENKRTLTRNPIYTDFISNLNRDFSLISYVSPARYNSPLLALTAPEHKDIINKHRTTMERFDGCFTQYTITKPNLFYTSAFLRHNPQTKSEVASLWELELDTAFVKQPWLLRNHNTNGLDIAIQDEAHQLYLISGTGSVFWKKKLNEAIIGDVHQVDALKNGKLQMAFVTANALHVLDRNGNYLPGFPVKLKAPATAPLTVMDYERNREYRLLVSCNDKRTYNYTVKGTPVEGWKNPLHADILQSPVLHTILQGKDYVIMPDQSGKITITDRQGNVRLKLKEQIPERSRFVYLEPGKDLVKTKIVTIDSSGNLYKLSLSDNLERTRFPDFSHVNWLMCEDLDQDGKVEYIAMDEKKLVTYANDQRAQFRFSFEQPVKLTGGLYRFDNNDVRIGAVTAESEELYLINKGGVMAAGFPIKGNSSFSIGRMHPNQQPILVTTLPKNRLVAYSIIEQ